MTATKKKLKVSGKNGVVPPFLRPEDQHRSYILGCGRQSEKLLKGLLMTTLRPRFLRLSDIFPI